MLFMLHCVYCTTAHTNPRSPQPCADLSTVLFEGIEALTVAEVLKSEQVCCILLGCACTVTCVQCTAIQSNQPIQYKSFWDEEEDDRDQFRDSIFLQVL